VGKSAAAAPQSKSPNRWRVNRLTKHARSNILAVGSKPIPMKKLLISSLILVLAGLGFWFGRPAYRHYKEKRFVAQAERFMKQSEFPKAWVSVRQVLRLNPNNVRACHIMADLTESSRSPQTVIWRQRVASLEPTLDNRLALASCALHFDNPPYRLATETLKEIGAEGESLPAYHVVAAELAVRMDQFAEAERQLQ